MNNRPLTRLARWLVLPALALAVCGLRAEAAAAAEPRALVETAVTEVLDTIQLSLDSKQSVAVRIRPVLANYFDFEAVTRRAIGPGWREFSPEQRTRVTELFTDLVIRTYSAHLSGESTRPAVAVATATPLAQGRVEVASTITYQGNNYTVSYRLELTDGRWRIYDVIIEGVSMVANYRGQFDSIFRKGGAVAIIKSLETKLAEVPPAA